MIRMAAYTLGALALTLSVAQAQSTVSTADIQRLQDRVYDAGSEVSRIRARDGEVASRLQSELDDLREEVIYLKVKLRKEGSVPRAEYTALRDRIDRVASRARSENGANDSAVGQPQLRAVLTEALDVITRSLHDYQTEFS